MFCRQHCGAGVWCTSLHTQYTQHAWIIKKQFSIFLGMAKIPSKGLILNIHD